MKLVGKAVVSSERVLFLAEHPDRDGSCAGKGGKGQAHGSSLAARVAAATQQRQKLEAILQQDRENLIMEQSQHAGSPHAELRESQLQDAVSLQSGTASNKAWRLHPSSMCSCDILHQYS